MFKNITSPSYRGEVANCILNWMVEQGNRYAEPVLDPQFSMESERYTTFPYIPEGMLKQKYLEDRFSTRAIAREFSCSKTYVRSQLLKYKIPLREPSKYHKNHSRIYGKRKFGSRTIDHKGELRTITAIRRMYSEGISTAAIARFLDAMKVPTKRQGKGWHNYMIIKILEREGLYKSRRKQWTQSSVSL